MRGIKTKDGVIDLYDERIVLMPPNIIDLLAQIYGEGSKSLLIFLGKKMGIMVPEKRVERAEEMIDKFFLPHIGHSKEDRILKAYFLQL